ncbi:hypothetical protein ACFWBR_26780 [Streptomyces sp. NPDC060006]|uniref:hypothetical protein n=1 Tax=unclassified Streptomyces TaxID=2593676 RepID=UPI0036C987B2
MRTFSRCLITALAAGCLAVTAGAAATTATAATGPAVPLPWSQAAPGPQDVPGAQAAPDPVPGACDVDWPKLAGLTGPGTLHDAIVACTHGYTGRDLESWLQAPPKPPKDPKDPKQPVDLTDPVEQSGQTGQTGQAGQKEQDWTGADAGDWDDDLGCDLAEIFDEPTGCRAAP